MHDTLVLVSIVVRALATLACIGGAVYLMFHDKDGWGWLLFVAVIIGSYSLVHKPDGQEVKQTTILEIK